MPDNFSLEELVLNYSRQLGGIVEPPAYGAYEVLLPDEVAARWGVNAHQRFAFGPEIENATFVYYGHSLVETIVEELRQKIANARFFINNVRPNKPRLYQVVEKAISLPNAKMFPVPGAAEILRLHHYVQFNFKVSLIADEKRELVLPLWMNLQGGYAVKSADIEQVAILDVENGFPDTLPAGLRWSNQPPLSLNAFTALLDRARDSVADELGDTLSALQKRLRRFLELDRARLNDYYDDLRKDAERRLSKADEERRPALEAKLAAIEAERQSKLEDVEHKYHLRVQLELLNLAVIAQPKLDLAIEIRKRTASVNRTVTWDPLLHTVEGLVCDVCGLPGYSPMLCENGHLAHVECLAAQCVECKRTFCLHCAHEVKTCVVCDRPVCVHSLRQCATCRRATCQEHAEMCHAANGEPVRVVEQAAQSASQSSAPKTEAGDGGKVSSPATGKSARQTTPLKRETAKTRKQPPVIRPEISGDYLEVYSDPENNCITAYVMVKKREIATREWSMTNQGLAVNCWCEKPACRERGVVYRPAEAERITTQMVFQVEQFAQEYGVSEKKIRFFHVRLREAHTEKRLKVPASWKEPALLEQAQAGFDRLRRRR